MVFVCQINVSGLLQAEDCSVVSNRWSVIFDNIYVIIPQNYDCSSGHVKSVAELLLSLVVDCRCQLHRHVMFLSYTICK